MNVVIYGVARSGTTALYSLLQEIFLDQFGRDVDFVYEPFLRRKEFFNGLYNGIIDNFKYIDSISYEGIAAHLNLPLFVENPANYKKNAYLNNIFNSKGNRKNLLVKFIRANGRFKLIAEICPESKFIYIIRNPMDVINSISSLFSFFGGEFHWDDFPRFINEINQLYGERFSSNNTNDEIKKDLLFWYYMNKFVLDNVNESTEKVLLICHEEFVKNRAHTVKRICDFLGFKYKSEYLELSKLNVGPVTRRFKLSREEYKIVKKYLIKYFDFLASKNIKISTGIDEITNKYEISDHEVSRKRRFYGLHSRAIQGEYEALLKKMNNQLLTKDRIIKEKQRMIEWLKRKINE